MSNPPKPNEDLASEIARAYANEEIRTVRRFPTGLAHYVYDVTTQNDQKMVVRMSTTGKRNLLRSGIRWSENLRPLGVPLPEILHSDTDAEVPYVILERLEGSDLGDQYGTLEAMEKRQIAGAVCAAQSLVSQLPQGPGYGFASSYETGATLPSWKSVIDQSIARSRNRIDSVGVVDLSFVDAIEGLLPRYQSYFETIQPTPFLDDTTTKNVIVLNGKLTGIVDVDTVCFGDPVFTIGLTRMALMSMDAELDYVEYWCEQIHATEEQRSAVSFYSALFCVDFMGEIGQSFNRGSAELDRRWLERLKICHTEIMDQIYR